MSIHYSISYITSCLTESPVPAPDKGRVGNDKDYQLLVSLYETNNRFGVDAVKLSWTALKKTVPHLDKRPRYMNANSLKDIQIPRYAPGGYPIYQHGMNVLVGARGGGKSFVALDASAKIAKAQPDRPVIYTAGEGLPSYVTRWEAWKTHYKTTPTNLIFWDGALQMLNPTELTEFVDEFKPLKPSFIVVDTVARAMTGFNENDTQQMGEFVANCEAVMKELGCGMLLVHHIGRAGVMRGSTALDGGADSVMVLARDGQTIVLHNAFEKGGKNRFQMEMPSIALRFESVDVTIDGKKENGAVVLPTEMPEESSDVNLTALQAKILEVIEAGKTTAQEIVDATGTGKSTVFYNLNSMKKTGIIAQHPVTKAYEVTISKTQVSS